MPRDLDLLVIRHNPDNGRIERQHVYSVTQAEANEFISSASAQRFPCKVQVFKHHRRLECE